MQPDSLTGAAADSTELPPYALDKIIAYIDRLPSEGIYVAISIGLLLYLIGWFGGGTQQQKSKVLAVVIIITVISIFSLPVPTNLFIMLAPSMGVEVAFSVVSILWLMFLLGMAISLYETFIVTAEEAGFGR